jgi:hypothetical protein
MVFLFVDNRCSLVRYRKSLNQLTTESELLKSGITDVTLAVEMFITTTFARIFRGAFPEALRREEELDDII